MEGPSGAYELLTISTCVAPEDHETLQLHFQPVGRDHPVATAKAPL